MQVLIAGATLVFAAAITPGPNNFLVLRIAIDHGVKAALPAIAGIVLGGLVMLALAQFGLAALFNEHAWLRTIFVMGGGAYLAGLGALLVWRSFAPAATSTHSGDSAPRSALALLAFQFVNPKSWTLVLTVVAATQLAADGGGRLAVTGALFALLVAIPFACLLAWAAFGRVAARLLHDRSARACFDGVMGALLALSAIALVVHR
jgi:threonine/homoserine/homoserine lactone efflux protein